MTDRVVVVIVVPSADDEGGIQLLLLVVFAVESGLEAAETDSVASPFCCSFNNGFF